MGYHRCSPIDETSGLQEEHRRRGRSRSPGAALLLLRGGHAAGVSIALK